MSRGSVAGVIQVGQDQVERFGTGGAQQGMRRIDGDGLIALGGNRKITFSDFSYTEMVLDLEPSPDAITLDSDPYVIIRPEGDWDRPGVLDMSSGREVTLTLRVIPPSCVARSNAFCAECRLPEP